LIQTPADESAPRFSPDGRWVTYVSDASGRTEIYVQPYPPSGEKFQISADGGREPVWAPGGAELFYRNGDKLMVAEIKTQPAFTAARPRQLFEGGYEGPVSSRANFDISPDGRRFLMLQAAGRREASAEIKIVTNWFDEVRRRAPAKYWQSVIPASDGRKVKTKNRAGQRIQDQNPTRPEDSRQESHRLLTYRFPEIF